MQDRGWKDVGGTSGGLGHFLTGLALACLGGYLFLSRIVVASYGAGGTGLALLALLFGFVLLFRNDSSLVGRLLVVGSLLVIVADVVSHLRFYVIPMSLLRTVIMLALLFGGVALILRSLGPRRAG